ncbi:MAG: hypothetical protein CVV27_13820 [Candidatus Melainabacteria bacterium HGW-Melainabacteria-1]|nr:MAG: hypothetical protein CVV27_13820 [Candidatus Melainabacteria bacterium HGW-Melainabacteria-1]
MKHWKEFALGLFILGAAALLAYMSITIGKVQFGDTLKVEAVFRNASGVVKDAPVMLAGIEVGHVAEMEVVNNELALMKMVIDPDVKVHADARAEIRSKSLLGEKYINLIPGSDAAPMLNDGERINDTMTPVDLDEVLNHLAPVLTKLDPEDVNTLVHTLAVSIKGREKQIGRVIDGAAVVMDTVSENRDGIGRIVRNLDAAAAQANALLGRNGRQIDAIVDNLHVTSVQLRHDTPGLFSDLNTLSGGVNKLTAPFIDRSEILAERLDRITDSADRLTVNINSHPELIRNLNDTLLELPPLLKRAPETLDRLPVVLDQLSPVLTGANDLLPDIKQTLKHLDPVLLKADTLLDEKKIRDLLQKEGIKVQVDQLRLW